MLYLVYEVNSHISGCKVFDEGKVRLFYNKDDALAELVSRKENYITSGVSDFKYNREESDGEFILFSHIHDECVCFYIAMTEIAPEGKSPIIPRMRLEELCTQFKDGLIEDGEEDAYTYFREICELSDTEAEWLGLEHWQDEESEFDDSAAWEDDSSRGCKDCPPDECTGHCMSCFYRPV